LGTKKVGLTQNPIGYGGRSFGWALNAPIPPFDWEKSKKNKEKLLLPEWFIRKKLGLGNP